MGLFLKEIICSLTLLRSEWPKLHRVLAVMSTIGLKEQILFLENIASVGREVTTASEFPLEIFTVKNVPCCVEYKNSKYHTV